PIGKPAANVKLYILDKAKNPVPDGVSGELYIGGDGVCRGYLNKSQLTAEKFIDNPFCPGEKIYKSGDYAKRREDGIVEYLGRVDDQVKIRGHRIECLEIQTKLEEIAGIEKAVLSVESDKNQGKYLVAYYKCEGKQEIEKQSIRNILSTILPQYMIPSEFHEVTFIPLSGNGKLNKKKVNEYIIKNKIQNKKSKVLTETEQKLIALFKKYLKIDHSIGINDDFFDLGGNSLLAILIAQAAKKEGIEFKSYQLLEFPSIAQLTETLPTNISQPVERDWGNNSDEVPLSPIQKWYFNHSHKNYAHFNQYCYFSANHQIDEKILNLSLQDLMNRHDQLRAKYEKTDGEWKQIITQQKNHNILSTYDLSGKLKKLQEKEKEEIINQKQAELSLSHPPLVWAVLFKIGNRKYELVISIHHLITDLISWSVLIDDLNSIYQSKMAGHDDTIDTKSTSFLKWVTDSTSYIYQQDFSKDIKYWSKINNNSQIPLDYPDFSNEITYKSLDKVILSLSKEDSEKLSSALQQKYHFQAYHLLLTCLVSTLTSWIGKKDIWIDFESHGRENLGFDHDLSRTIGWFTAVYPVLFSQERGNNYLDLTNHIMNQLNNVPNQGITYGLLKYIKQDKSIVNLPSSEIAFNYLGDLTDLTNDNHMFKLEHFAGMSVDPGNKLSYLLNIDVIQHNKQFHIVFSYSKNIFKEKTMIDLKDKLSQEIITAANQLFLMDNTELSSPNQICKRCILPDSFTKISFNENLICNYCEKESAEEVKVDKNDFKNEEELIEVLAKYRGTGDKYDVLVPLSGGVDSSNALINIVEKYKLKALGYHFDNGYEDKTARQNVEKLCQTLNVDLQIQDCDPDFMKKLWCYTHEAEIQGLSGCFVCGGVLYASAIETALKNKIPLIINGYSKGQAAMMADKKNVLEFWGDLLEYFNKDPVFFDKFMDIQKPMSHQKIYFKPDDLKKKVDKDKIFVIPFYIFNFYQTNKEKLREICAEKFDWQPMKVSYPGRSTNCEMVWLNTYMDLKRMGHTMYHQEYAELVRKGDMTREQALNDLEFHPPKGLIKRLAQEVGLKI
ncbi:MAG: condensation domain-containing protein, partial [Spirochaetes bacterium]|nr:condensation domain-containing protein [Spirochaetota bacterium]